ncbi:DUF2634 domain-containing protein [Clostridium oceanicum]|uniref:DUF2634 domain-containing protein n=1 Tax=Clostridium oceanicum TaxID=1543 RepID=A0ABP3UKQ0_9CLOT
MPSLFPEDMNFEENNIEELEEPLQFKGSYLFDFSKGEFVKNPDGTLVKCDDLQAYKQWCEIAMLTDRYMYVFSELFGQEFHGALKNNLNNSALELEIKRITKETLMVHPRSKDVTNFSFKWSDNKEEVHYKYEVITIYEEKFTLNKIMKVG